MLKTIIAPMLVIFSVICGPVYAEPPKHFAEKFGEALGYWIQEMIYGSHEHQFLEAGLKNCIESFEKSREPQLNGFELFSKKEDGTREYIRNRITLTQKSIKEDEYRACTVEIFTLYRDGLEIDWPLIKKTFDDWADQQIQNKRYCNVEPKDPNGYMRILAYKGPRDGKAIRVALNIIEDLNFGFIVAGELDWAEAYIEC